MHHLVEKGQAEPVAMHVVDREGLDAFLSAASPSTQAWIEHQSFEPLFGNHVVFADEKGAPAGVLIGCEEWPHDPRATAQLFARVALSLPKRCHYALAGQSAREIDGFQAALGWGLAGYRYARYRDESPVVLPNFVLPDDVELALVSAQLDAIFFARDLINTPPNDLGPAEMCAAASELAQDHGAEILIIRGDDLLEANYPAIHTVGAGSYREPALVDLRWGKLEHPKLTLVGKGVIFDTGGLNLKGGSGMKLMKKDMGGAAMVMGLAKLIMTRQLPVRLRLLVPAVENSPGRNAYRPSDVIRTRKGISVEIGNTDAEGRVIMCDALAEAVAENPDLLIDAATLTGACRVALGPEVPGFWTADDQLGFALQQAAGNCGDPVWQLPLWQPYRRFLDSDVADINNNSSSAQGGAIAAALYLYEFVKPFDKWVHVDMNGWNVNDLPGFPKGGEASALRAVFQFLSERYGQ